ncbi:MAG: M48 family metallopeptidase [Phycisphaerales bacterium]
MSTDFFTSQDNARKQTGRLVALFIFGVAGTMVSLWLVLAGILATQAGPKAFARWELMLGVFVVTGAVVGIATLFKLAQLSQGGPKIAEMLGGRPVDPATRDPKERQLLNLVEEMSIASGVPVPPVYVMEDRSVNAFAAGPDPSRSVIGVTRGCMELLSRDELQGVIAHEYSHIFHGDTRINARTTAVIAGIMAVGVIGYIMFRFVGPTIARSSGRGKNNPGPAIGLAIIVGGLAVWAIGSLGMLFGRLIQAAISRQREFLADAAAVQYTRNPDGIAGALAKIRDHVASARIESPAASELNHFFFCSSLNTLFATHPPIDERIKRIVAMGATRVGAQEAQRAGQARGGSPSSGGGRAAGAAVAGFAEAGRDAGRDTGRGAATETGTRAGAGTVADEVAHAGTLDAASIARAQAWKASLPTELAEAARTADGARAICYAIARRTAAHAACDAVVAERDRAAYDSYAALVPAVAALRADMQVALADLAAPALFNLGQRRYGEFRQTLAQAIRSDGQIDLREWSLVKSLERHVERRFTQAPATARGGIAAHAREAQLVLAIIAGATHDGRAADDAFAQAARAAGLAGAATPPASDRTLDRLSDAVRALSTTTFAERARFLEACAIAAAHDGRISVDEHLIVRSVADALDVPLPALAEV